MPIPPTPTIPTNGKRNVPAILAATAAAALIVLGASVTTAVAEAGKDTPRHAIAMYGAPKYGPGFKSFDYANPAAVKGGGMRFAAIGTFDTLNPFTLKGVAAEGLGDVWDSLTANSLDEPFTAYGLVAETMEMPDDRSSITYTIRKEARWHNGKPITPEDVIFSLDTLRTKGEPFYRLYFASIAKAEKIGPRKVKFTFVGGVNRELPLITGQMPVLSKDYWQGKDFSKTTLTPPLGSGPYRIKSFEAGRSITYERVKDYWGKDLGVRKGQDNFDTIRYDYYRDATVALEDFKAGEYDFRRETVSKNWATAYDFPAIRQGLVIKKEIRNQRPTGMQAFVFNTRRQIFRDRRVREALAYAFDFEWTNKNLFYGQYIRTRSYFSNSELASTGLPSKAELKILEPYRGRIPDEVFTKIYQPPKTDGSGNIRQNLRRAFKLLKAAGWTFRDRKLVDAKTGKPFTFQILLVQPTWERIALPFVRNLARLGIDASVRTVDAAQYQKRLEEFDFDMVVGVFGQSLSPGNEQRDLWSSAAAATPGSRNIIGIKDKVVDELINLIIAAPDWKTLVARTRALDRVLLWGYYVIPHWHIQSFRIAFWNKFGQPKINPKYGLCIDCWWADAKKEAALTATRKGK